MTQHLKAKKGFTLVELMIVITVIAILATIGVISFTRVQAQTRDTKRKADMRAVSTALQAYFTEKQTYPTQLSDLVPTYVPTLPVDPQNGSQYVYDNNATTNLYGLCVVMETATSSANTWKVSTANPGGYATAEVAANCTAE